MKVSTVCNNYFNILQDKDNLKKEKWKVVTLIVLKILSYMTVVIPLGFAIAYGISSKKEPDIQEAKITIQAKKRFTYRKKESEPKDSSAEAAQPKKTTPKKSVLPPKKTAAKPNAKPTTPMTQEEITTELDKINQIPKEETQAKAYRDLVVQLIRRGNLFEALEHAENIPNKKYIQEVKSQLALEFARKGIFDMAVSLADRVYNEPWRKKGQPIDETKESLRLFRDLSEIMGGAVKQLKQEGREEEAQRLFEMMPDGKVKEVAEKEIAKSKKEPEKTA